MPGRDLLGKKFGELAKLDLSRGRIVEEVACGCLSRDVRRSETAPSPLAALW
jgi:hypothetical protein